MTRGNQRDLARAKNQKKQQELNKKRNDDGLTPEQRRERDALRLKEKQAMKANGGTPGQGQPSSSK